MAGSQVVGRGGPGVDISVHLGAPITGVVSTLDVTPGVPPVMVAPDPLLAEVGDTLTVAYHAPGGSGERVRIVPSGGDPVTDALDSQGTPPGAPIDGSVQFPTGALAGCLRRGADRRCRRGAGSRAVLGSRRRRPRC